eukprot:TRINITY_DN31504_c0_g1_i1.p1 TRINITY_DN31504_c0_g1~~TRINITY_DN31504_c0_g1_i1.p1  ORF type:complete len:466 (+),score=82.98 TRINITY_DN31504_c0_g1_i1:112-1509(+)
MPSQVARRAGSAEHFWVPSKQGAAVQPPGRRKRVRQLSGPRLSPGVNVAAVEQHTHFARVPLSSGVTEDLELTVQESPQSTGVYVSAVADGSEAERAGVAAPCLLLRVGARLISSREDLCEEVARATSAGEQAVMLLLRGLHVTPLAPYLAPPVAPPEEEAAGTRCVRIPITGPLGVSFTRREDGPLHLDSVEPGGAADLAGLGDVVPCLIVRAGNTKRPCSGAELRAAIAAARAAGAEELELELEPIASPSYAPPELQAPARRESRGSAAAAMLAADAVDAMRGGIGSQRSPPQPFRGREGSIDDAGRLSAGRLSFADSDAGLAGAPHLRPLPSDRRPAWGPAPPHPAPTPDPPDYQRQHTSQSSTVSVVKMRSALRVSPGARAGGVPAPSRQHSGTDAQASAGLSASGPSRLGTMTSLDAALWPPGSFADREGIGAPGRMGSVTQGQSPPAFAPVYATASGRI